MTYKELEALTGRSMRTVQRWRKKHDDFPRATTVEHGEYVFNAGEIHAWWDRHKKALVG